MKRIIIKIKEIIKWALELKYIYLSMGIVLLSFSIFYFVNSSENFVRLTGLILQLLGICTVIWGISATRAFFGLPSFANKLKSWASRCPIRSRKEILGVADLCLPHLLMNATGFSSNTSTPSASLDERIDAIEKNINFLHQSLSQLKSDLNHNLNDIKNEVKAEANIREADDKSIREMLEAFGTGGIHISAIGAVCLFLGVIFSTAASEIAAILK